MNKGWNGSKKRNLVRKRRSTPLVPTAKSRKHQSQQFGLVLFDDFCYDINDATFVLLKKVTHFEQYEAYGSSHGFLMIYCIVLFSGK